MCFTKILLMPILLLENNCKIILFIKALIKWHGISLSQMTMYMLQMTWNISGTNDMEYLCDKWPCICYKWHGISLSQMTMYITNLVCYTYFHWFFSPECQHIFGKQTGYISQSPKTIKTWTTKHYASLNQWYNTE